MTYQMLGAGNANTIYIHPDGLLRVSKAGRDPQEILDYYGKWHDRIPDYIGSMKIVDDPHYGKAILMDYIGKNDTLLVEFKPKWLIQSPDAPSNAKACRTCAVNALRNKRRKWCPLAMYKREGLLADVQGMKAKHPEAVAEFLEQRDLLDLLAQYQQGPSVFEPPSKEFLDAMSARDCTILIEGNKSDESKCPEGSGWSFHQGVWVRARVVDLDPKLEDQMGKWRGIETSLKELYDSGVDGCLLAQDHS